MEKTLNYLTILTSLFVLCTFHLNGQEVDLKLSLNKGDKFYEENSVDQIITQEIMGLTQTIEQKITFGYEYHVIDVLPNNNYKMKITYEKVAYKQDSQYLSTNYNSEDPNTEINAQTQPYAALKGLEFILICDSKGNISNIYGLDKMIEEIIRSYGEEITDEQKTSMKEAFKTQFGDEAMKSSFANSMNMYPDHVVKVGTEWSRDITIQAAMPLVLNNSWKLESLNGNLANVSIHSIINLKTDSKPEEVQGMETTYDLEGDQTGNIILNIETGLAEKTEIDQKINGTMVMPNGMRPEPMKIPLEIESKIIITKSKR